MVKKVATKNRIELRIDTTHVSNDHLIVQTTCHTFSSKNITETNAKINIIESHP